MSYHLVKPRTREEVRPVIQYLAEHRQKGDILYLYHGVEQIFQFYSERYGFGKRDYIVLSIPNDDKKVSIPELGNGSESKRVWVLFSHVRVNRRKKLDDEKTILSLLDEIGECAQSFRRPGASIYLYIFP